jgi:hypothetical protein
MMRRTQATPAIENGHAARGKAKEMVCARRNGRARKVVPTRATGCGEW